MKTNRLVPALAIILLNLTACDYWTVKPYCDRQYAAPEQAAACAVGASELADQVRQATPTIGSEEGHQKCQDLCTQHYSMADGSSDLFSAVTLADLQAACSVGCKSSVDYQRAADLGEAYGCEEIRTAGGTIRCD